MEHRIIGLGSNSSKINTIGEVIIDSFMSKDYHSLFIITAFSSTSAVNGIIKLIEGSDVLKNVTIVTGIDQKGTSKEALQLLNNPNIQSYIFFNYGHTIFHPKIYLFEGDNVFKLLIGSSNLTAQGLFQNMESSVEIILDKKNDNLTIIDDLKQQFDSIFNLNDPNLKEITNEIIEELVKLDYVPDESDRRKMYGKLKTENKNEELLEIKKIFPSRKVVPVHTMFKNKGKNKEFEEIISEIEKEIDNVASDEILLWRSGGLSERDLNIPKGKTTNPTGSMLLKKGKEKNIDQRHYFREQVFSELEWQEDQRKPHLERAWGKFELIIDDVSQGIFDLKISHNRDVKSESYVQKNSVTSISWGTAKKFLTKDELLGKQLKLYKKDNLFIIKIN